MHPARTKVGTPLPQPVQETSMSKPNQAPAPGALSKDDIKYLERTLSNVPMSKSQSGGNNDAEQLLQYAYHTNPYLRVFCKVLWSGYAIARGQLADGHQRFVSARKDAGMSAVDAMTTKALDDAHSALEAAMGPTGSMQQFLLVLRDKTLQRLWSRVCETSKLPPPRFHVLFGQKATATAADLDAHEEAELEALRLVPSTPATPPAAPASADSDDKDDDDEDDDGPATEAGPERLHIEVKRQGSAETAPEWLLTAVSEALRDLRVKKGSGNLQLVLTLTGDKVAGGGDKQPGGGGRKRRRRR